MKTWVLILAAIVVAAMIYSLTGSQLVSAEQAKELIRRGATVVDVRTDIEWNLGHHPKALHIPVADIPHQAQLKKKDAVIVVYCNSGQRARSGAESLHAQGFTRTYYIAGTYLSLIDE